MHAKLSDQEPIEISSKCSFPCSVLARVWHFPDIFLKSIILARSADAHAGKGVAGAALLPGGGGPWGLPLENFFQRLKIEPFLGSLKCFEHKF